MKYYAYYLISLSALLKVFSGMAMQPASYNPTPIIQRISLPAKPIAITSNEPGIMGVLDHSNYTLWDYKTGKRILTKCAMIRNKNSVCFHPTQDKAFFPGDHKSNNEGDKNAFFVKYDDDGTGGKAFYRNEYGISSGIFSKEDPILFMIDKKKLLVYDYEKTAIHFELLKEKMGVIFAYPTDNHPYFLCSDYAQEKMYKITQVGGNFIIKKLFKFPFVVDFDNWIYNSQEKLFFFIDKNNRMLRVITIKDPKKIKINKYRYGHGFAVAAMAIHPNKKILVLLSQKSNVIQFIDVRNYQNIRHVLTSIYEPLGTHSPNKNKNEHTDKKIIFSQDGENMLMTCEKKCLVMGVPSFITYIAPLEKIFMIQVFKQYNISPEVRKLIWWFLFRLFR